MRIHGLDLIKNNDDTWSVYKGRQKIYDGLTKTEALLKANYHHRLNFHHRKDVAEEVPANNAGSGNVAGIGVGVAGEPGIPTILQKKKKVQPLKRQ